MAAIKDLLGETVLNAKSEKVDVGSFSGSGKIVGLYFSAHWCPPCQRFTPVLAEYYNKFKSSNFEIVFISSDRSPDECADYFASMPWLLLDFADRSRKTELGKKYGVEGIPTLIILNGETGDVISKEGRSDVMATPDKFAWK